MAIHRETIVTFTCDRCGFATQDPTEMQAFGDVAAYGTTDGGDRHDWHVCGKCRADLIAYLRGERRLADVALAT